MDALVYNLLHLFGILTVFFALGAAMRQPTGDAPPSRKLVGITHGVALLVILVSGFGLLAKLKLGFPVWVWLKLAIWLFVGALPVLIRRMPQHAFLLWLAVPVLGAVAAYLALYKPF